MYCPSTTMRDGTVIASLLDGKYYRYLGVEESNKLVSKSNMKRLVKE